MSGREQLLNDVLEAAARELDIPPYKYKQAMERYDAIKRHLEDGEYPAATPPPSGYMQGSFRYGTVVRPLRESKEGAFDIDMVCEVNRDKKADDPESLKNDVGDEVKAYARKTSMHRPKNKRRCWTLEYTPDDDDIEFHVDVLPSVPDPTKAASILLENDGRDGTDVEHAITTIAITNRDDAADPPEHSWRSSNPNGYALWFGEICGTGLTRQLMESQKKSFFESGRGRDDFYVRWEDIPEALVRTPLQRAIQIMKRHRDMRFSGRPEEKHKPITMIITTLAARLYAGRADKLTTVASALTHIVDLLTQHDVLLSGHLLQEDVAAMGLIQRADGRWYIPNPVNPHYPGDADEKGENFADRWHEDGDAAAKAFFQWMGWLREDMDALLRADSVAAMEKTLMITLGERVTGSILRRFAPAPSPPPASLVRRMRLAALTFFNVSWRERPRWPMRTSGSVAIRAWTSQNGFRAYRCPYESGGASLPKGLSIKFEVRTDVRLPYEIYWQVTNTGDEATEAGDLRGGIVGDSSTHYETTQYRGSHCVECFVVQGGVCVARSGEFTVKIR